MNNRTYRPHRWIFHATTSIKYATAVEQKPCDDIAICEALIADEAPDAQRSHRETSKRWGKFDWKEAFGLQLTPKKSTTQLAAGGRTVGARDPVDA